MTDSIKLLLKVTSERREVQAAYNKTHSIEPKTIIREVAESLVVRQDDNDSVREDARGGEGKAASVETLIAELEEEMKEASERLEFERAALLRDQILELRATMGGGAGPRPKSKGKKGRKGVHKGATYKVKRGRKKR